MKLYYAPGACSLSPHIALREAGLEFDLVRVDLRQKTTADGADFREVNPKGCVPALVLDDGALLTEAAVVVQYIADRKPEAGLAPAHGTMERYRLQEWLNFIATDVHKLFGPLFNPATSAERRAEVLETIGARLDAVSAMLGDRPYLMGERFTVADGYLFTVVNWTGFVGIDLGRWPTLQAFQRRVAERPAVRAALEAEGLLKN